MVEEICTQTTNKCALRAFLNACHRQALFNGSELERIIDPFYADGAGDPLLRYNHLLSMMKEFASTPSQVAQITRTIEAAREDRMIEDDFFAFASELFGIRIYCFIHGRWTLLRSGEDGETVWFEIAVEHTFTPIAHWEAADVPPRSVLDGWNNVWISPFGA